MKKSIISLSLLAIAGMAQAQSSVTVYGAVDIGYVKSTDSSVTMGERYNSRLGFMGTEDLGGGLKATFQLEQRFTLASGQSSSLGNFEGAANVGLAGSFGQFRFGRVNELSTETFRVIDPFQQYGVGSMFTTVLRGNDGSGRLSNTARYDSPNLNGFQFGATYTTKPNTTNWLIAGFESLTGFPFPISASDLAPNVGYGLSSTYTNGPVYLVANYNKAANTNNSYNWNVGGAYVFGPAKISLGYEQTKDKFYAWLDDENFTTKGKKWLVGLSYTVGNGVIHASYNSRTLSAADSIGHPETLGTDKKYALGYTHNLSKRTSVYVEGSTTKYGDSSMGARIDLIKGTLPLAYLMRDDAPTRVNAFAVGITHKF